MKVPLVAMLLISILIKSYAQQKLTLEYIDTALARNDTTYRPMPNMLYVIDGVPYVKPDDELAAALSKIATERVMDIVFSKSAPTDCYGGDYVIINTFGKQTTPTKTKYLQMAKMAFKDKYHGFSQHILPTSQDPVLFLNDRPVHHTECSEVLKKLKIRDIKDMSVYLWPFSQAYLGQNAKNGVVKIWQQKQAAPKLPSIKPEI